MKRYSDYKATSLAWLTTIPKHWDIVRGKNLFKRLCRPVRAEDEIVTAFRDGTVTLRKNRREEGFTNALHEIGYQGIRKGDLVIHAMDGFAGAIGVSDSDGKSTPVYAVCQPIHDANPFYFARLLRRMALSGYIQALSRGIRERSTEFRYDQFANLSYPVPPREEQDAIVAFLEAKEAQINKFIASKRRMIELLKEQLNTTIEKSLKEEVAMQAKIGYFLDLLPGFAFSSENFTSNEDNIRLLRGINVSPNEIRWDETVRWNLNGSMKLKDYELRVGDIVFGMDRPWVGSGMRVAEIQESDLPCLLVQRVARLRAKKGLLQSYLKLLLSSRSYKAYFEPILTGISVPHISPSQIAGFRCSIPSLEKQESIVKCIEQKRHETKKAITLIEKEIALIEEYRASLIDTAATGKIDVRRGVASAVEV